MEKIYVVVGIYHGCLHGVRAFYDEEEALLGRDEMDKELGIERDEDGNYESDNTCVLEEVPIEAAHL